MHKFTLDAEHNLLELDQTKSMIFRHIDPFDLGLSFDEPGNGPDRQFKLGLHSGTGFLLTRSIARDTHRSNCSR